MIILGLVSSVFVVQPFVHYYRDYHSLQLIFMY